MLSSTRGAPKAAGRMLPVRHVSRAPAGYGKTTLLAQAAAADPRPAAWLSIDRRGDDPVVLLAHLVEALARVVPLGPDVYLALQGPAGSIWSLVMPRIGRALRGASAPLLLALDNVDALSSPDAVDAVLAIADHLPAGSQVIMTGRSVGRLPWPRLRTSHTVLEIDAPSLAMSDDEAAGLLDGAGSHVAPEEAARLNRATEGWAAGLALVALGRRGAAPASSNAPRAGERYVEEYLRSEVLAHTSRSDREFLLRTSILERLSGGLCDEMLGSTDAAAVLERLVSENHFVVALDHERRWYRYHSMFRALLLAELERVEPERIPDLQARAARWHVAHGPQEDAVAYAHAAGDERLLSALVMRFGQPFYNTGRAATVARWIEWFEQDDAMRRHPDVAALSALFLALMGHPARALAAADALQGTTVSGASGDGSPIEAVQALVRAYFCREGPERMLEDAETAVATLRPDGPWRPLAHLLRGVAHLLTDEPGKADPDAASAVELGARWPDRRASGSITALAVRARLALVRGDRRAARDLSAQSRALCAAARLDEAAAATLVFAVSARVALAHGDQATGRRDLAHALRLRHLLTDAVPWAAVLARLEMVRAHLSLADPAGARTVMREVDGALRIRPDLGRLSMDAAALRTQLAGLPPGTVGMSTLTAAELRLLPYLRTHLTFREIGERLSVTGHTIKSQAMSTYRKLDATSRAEAIEAAIAVGLLDGDPDLGR